MVSIRRLCSLISGGGRAESDAAKYEVPQLSKISLLAGAFSWVGGGLLLAAFVPYDRSNFQWTLGAELQAVAAVFALAITGTLIATQMAQATTPRMVPFLAARTASLVVAFVVAVLVADVVTLMALPNSESASAAAPTYWDRFALCAVIIANVAAIVLIVAFARLIIARMQPEAILAALLSKLAGAHDETGQRTVIHTLEELGQHACERRQIQTCMQVTEVLTSAARIVPGLTMERDDPTGWASDPGRMIPTVLGRLGCAYADAGLDDAMATIAWNLAHVAASCHAHDPQLLDPDFDNAMEDVIDSCGRASRGWAAFEFISDKRDAIRWLAEKNMVEAVDRWIHSISDDIDSCAKWGLIDAFPAVFGELEVLIDLASEGLLREGVDWEKFIQDKVVHVRREINAYHLDSAIPRLEDESLAVLASKIAAKL